MRQLYSLRSLSLWVTTDLNCAKRYVNTNSGSSKVRSSKSADSVTFQSIEPEDIHPRTWVLLTTRKYPMKSPTGHIAITKSDEGAGSDTRVRGGFPSTNARDVSLLEKTKRAVRRASLKRAASGNLLTSTSREWGFAGDGVATAPARSPAATDELCIARFLVALAH